MIKRENLKLKPIRMTIAIVFSLNMSIFSWGTCDCADIELCPDDVHADIAEHILEHSSIKNYIGYYGLDRNTIIDAARHEPHCYGVSHPGWSLFTSGDVFDYPITNQMIGVILHVVGDAGIPVGYHSPASDVWSSKNAEIQVYASGQLHIDEIYRSSLNNLYTGDYNSKLDSFYNAQTTLASNYKKWYSDNPYANDPSGFAKNGIINALRLGQAVLSEYFARKLLPDRDNSKYNGMIAYWKMDEREDAMKIMDHYGPLNVYMGDKCFYTVSMSELAAPFPMPGLTDESFPNVTIGIIDKALYFHEANSIRLPAINSDEITLSLWFNRDDNNNADIMPLFSGSRSNVDVQQQEGFELYFTSDSPNIIKFRLVSQNSSGTRIVKTCSYDLGDHLNEWYHVACTYCKPSGLQKMYINGRLVSTQYHSNSNTIVPLTTYNYMWLAISPENWVTNSIDINGFVGKIDDVKLFGKPLSYKEIAAECGKKPPVLTHIFNLFLE